MLSETEGKIRDEISGRKAFKHVVHLCGLGDRFAGTSGDLEAADYVAEYYQTLGFKLRKTRIPVSSFQQQEASLKASKPVQRDFFSITPYLSRSTPEEGITAEAVDVGDGEEEDFAGKNVDGRIAVIRARAEGPPKFWMGSYAVRAANHGAVGIVLVHSMPWPWRPSMLIGTPTVSKRFPEKEMPILCISSFDGQNLMYLLGKGSLELQMRVKTTVKEGESLLVSGFHEGSTNPRERIAVIAHRDNGIPQGADDNASGTATMLEIARVLSKHKPERTIEFISSTAEEDATMGSWNYCTIHHEELPQIKALFNIDMVGCGGPVNLVEKAAWPGQPTVDHPKWLIRMLDSVAEELGYYLGRMSCEWGVAEHGRFMDEGVPAAWFWKPDDPYYHTFHDTPDKVDPNALKAVGDIVAITVWRLSCAKQIPP